MRFRMQTCKIILATSLIWFLVDVVVLIYYTDCRGPGCESWSRDSKGPSADPLVHSDSNAIGSLGNHIVDEGVGNDNEDAGEFGVSYRILNVFPLIAILLICFLFKLYCRIS